MPARLFLLSAILVAAAHAEVVDRIAVTLDNEVIAASEVMQAIRLAAFLNGDAVDFGSAARRQAAERLVEQRLIRREMEMGRYAQPSATEAERLLGQIQTQRFQGGQGAAPGGSHGGPQGGRQDYLDALAKYGISEEELKAHLLWQAALMRFIDLRFRAGVQVADDDVRKYLDDHMRGLEDKPGSSGKLEELRGQIRRKLTAEQIDKQMDEWLKETRQRVRIVFRPEAFE